jgi:hypothetical protein
MLSFIPKNSMAEPKARGGVAQSKSDITRRLHCMGLSASNRPEQNSSPFVSNGKLNYSAAISYDQELMANSRIVSVGFVTDVRHRRVFVTTVGTSTNAGREKQP